MLLTKDSVFREGAVADGVQSLIRGEVVHWDADPLINILVVENVMSVAAEQIRETWMSCRNLGPFEFPGSVLWLYLKVPLSTS